LKRNQSARIAHKINSSQSSRNVKMVTKCNDKRPNTADASCKDIDYSIGFDFSLKDPKTNNRPKSIDLMKPYKQTSSVESIVKN